LATADWQRALEGLWRRWEGGRNAAKEKSGRGERIRTSGLYVPNVENEGFTGFSEPFAPLIFIGEVAATQFADFRNIALFCYPGVTPDRS
jgi:hypothetical protein